MKSKYIVIFLLLSITGYGQELLTLSEAVRITLENDYNIKVAENNEQTALNNSSMMANGFLPNLTAGSGANYRNQNIDITNHDGSEINTSGSTTLAYNASISLNYTLFDGMYRSYNFEKSKELYNLSKLQVRQVIENTMLDLFNAYYTVANLTEAVENLKESLEISKVRLLRVKYGADYGKNTQLDVLNAEVDVNTDSINLLNSNQNLANAKRNLNVLMGRNVTELFSIDTAVNYQSMEIMDSVLQKAQTENVRLLSAQKNLDLAGYNIKLIKTNRIPTIALNGGYNWNLNDYNEKGQFDKQAIAGPQAGVSLTWSIFDGGRTRVGLQNATIAS